MTTQTRPVTELDAVDAGLIMAALDDWAAHHPDPDDAARAAELAELIATHGLTLAD